MQSGNSGGVPYSKLQRGLANPEYPYVDVEVGLALLAFKDLFTLVCLASAGQIGCTALLAWRYQDPWLWKIAYAMLIISILRLTLIVSFHLKKQTLTAVAAYWWQNVYGVCTLPWCGSLAMLTFYTFRCHYITGQGICVMGTFSFCAGMSAVMGVRPWASYISGLMMLGVLAVCVAQSPDKVLACGSVFLIGLFAVTHCKAVSGKFNLVVEQLSGQIRLKQLAESDVLTGLANRRSFQECLNVLCSQAGSFAVLFLDLDRFKSINDMHGHSAGDNLLVQVAQRLKSQVRSSDIVARLGGDEFAILQTPAASVGSAESLAIRINQCIAQPFTVQDNEVSIGTSIGIKLSLGVGRDPEQVLNAADDALYHVKQAGRGGYSFAPIPASEANEAGSLETPE